MTQHTQLRTTLGEEEWRNFMSALDSAYTFRDHASTFQGTDPARITSELDPVLTDFVAFARLEAARQHASSKTF